MDQAKCREWRWHCCLWTLIATLIFINPIGYVGGGWDDWHYLTAARCWTESGACLPSDHWEGRWPVFAPIALIFEQFGESRLTLAIWPLAASMMSASLIAVIGNRMFHSPVGWLAASAFAVTPAFSIQLIGPSAEAIEVACLLGGALFVIEWLERKSAWAAFASGLCFGLAFQVKETSLVGATLAGVYVLTKGPRPAQALAAVAGFVLPMAVELIAYWVATGDPLYRRALSLKHTQIPSTELEGPIDEQRSPILNGSLIAGWRREPGLHVHWLLDGFINLLANAKAGLTLWLAPLGLLVLRPALSASERRSAKALIGTAYIYIAVLIFVFAIDPKPRMMFAPLVASTMAVAVITVAAWKADRRLLPFVMIGAHALVSVAVLFGHPRTDVFEASAKVWIEQLDGKVAIDRNSRRHFSMFPEAQSLPGLESDQPYWLQLSLTGCDAANPKIMVGGRQFKLLSVQRSTQPYIPGLRIPLELCIYRVNQGHTGSQSRS